MPSPSGPSLPPPFQVPAALATFPLIRLPSLLCSRAFPCGCGACVRQLGAGNAQGAKSTARLAFGSVLASQTLIGAKQCPYLPRGTLNLLIWCCSSLARVMFDALQLHLGRNAFCLSLLLFLWWCLTDFWSLAGLQGCVLSQTDALASAVPRVCYTRHPAAYVRHPAAPVRHAAPSIRHAAPSVQHPTASVRHPAAPVRHAAPSVRHAAASVRHAAPSVRHPAASVRHAAARCSIC